MTSWCCKSALQLWKSSEFQNKANDGVGVGFVKCETKLYQDCGAALPASPVTLRLQNCDLAGYFEVGHHVSGMRL